MNIFYSSSFANERKYSRLKNLAQCSNVYNMLNLLHLSFVSNNLYRRVNDIFNHIDEVSVICGRKKENN